MIPLRLSDDVTDVPESVPIHLLISIALLFLLGVGVFEFHKVHGGIFLSDDSWRGRLGARLKKMNGGSPTFYFGENV